MIYNSVSDMIGSTPMLKLNRLKTARRLYADIYVKLESMNPSGSVKDRAARGMLDDAEARGLLSSGSVIVEPTSGNTGIGLAMLASSRGYRLILTMPDTMTVERRKLLTAYGAEVVLTQGKLGMRGAIAKAQELAEELGAFVPSQFDNLANPHAHYLTTGPEILEDMDGKIDFLVAGIGTGGTISGTGRYLKQHCAALRVIAVEPSKSAVLSGEAPGAHGLQGLGAGFVPAALDTSVYDEIIKVTEDDAYTAARELAHMEGALVGISSGAALSAAFQIAADPDNTGKSIVVIAPDTGDRYLSTALFVAD